MEEESIKLRVQKELSVKKQTALSGSSVSQRRMKRVSAATSRVEEDVPRLRSGRREVRHSSQRRKTRSQQDQAKALEISPGSVHRSGPESPRLLLSLGDVDGRRHSGRPTLGTLGNPYVIVLEFRPPTDRLHSAVDLRSDAEDPGSSQLQQEDTTTQYSVPEHFLHTDNQRRQEPHGLPLEDLAQPKHPDPPSHQAQGSPEKVPSPGPLPLTQQGPSPPHLVLPEVAYRPDAVPCQVALEAGLGQWFKEAQCKICGALERCWAKLRRRYTQSHRGATELLQNRRISVEMKRRGRRRRRREKRGDKLRNRRDGEMAEWNRITQIDSDTIQGSTACQPLHLLNTV